MAKKIAILPANGLGDALLMHIASHHFSTQGAQVTTYHRFGNELSSLFSTPFCFLPPPKELYKELKNYDQIFVENDHSESAEILYVLRNEKKLPQVRFFFPKKSPWQQEGDVLFNQTLSMASNIAKTLLTSKKNGIIYPKGTHRSEMKQIAIHPTSGSIYKNWSKAQFLSLAKKLKEEGFIPVFLMHSTERREWIDLSSMGFEVPFLSTLKETASYLYSCGYFIGNDSGLGHLASNLGIPTLTIASDLKKIALWRPDWSFGKVVTPFISLPDFKGLKLKKNYWSHFTPVKRVLKSFHTLEGQL